MMLVSQSIDMASEPTLDPFGTATGEGEGLDPADRAAILAVRNGNHQAFGILVSHYQRRIYGLCLMMVKVHAEAEEVAQDTFVRAFTHLQRFDLDHALYPWLAIIAVRLAQSRIKKRAQDMNRDTVYLAEPSRQSPVPQSPLLDLVRDETSRDIWARVSELSEGQRAAVFMFYREDMKIADVAMALGVTVGTVKTLLHRARQNLRGHLREPGASEFSEEEFLE